MKNPFLVASKYPSQCVFGFEIMQRVFIGTKLEEGESHPFGHRDAESGLSKPALLGTLMLDCVAPIPIAIPDRPQGQP